ncbi:hypothetical protein [Streptomyces griseorubiginosus]|uniref:hypothetical protein n=1 Tax=Streptomyces griseorubiginosus TaxID=67304 RepID=UPI0036E561E2
MSTPFTSAEAQRAVELLASLPLVRLVTEIDDNGAYRRDGWPAPCPTSPDTNCAAHPTRPAPTASSGSRPALVWN